MKVLSKMFGGVHRGISRLERAVFPHEKGAGAIMVDHDLPAYTWRDITGIIRPDPIGANAPTLTTFRGGAVRSYAFGATDKIDCEFHIPHDLVCGPNCPSLYLHHHWSHNGTAISGTLAATASTTYSKGHYEGTFPAEKTFAFSKSTPNIATIPRWVHGIEEVEIAKWGGSGSLYDMADIEPDGLLLVNFTVDTIPTITGGSPNEPFILHLDLHYASTNIGTRNRSPNFWLRS